MIKNNNWKGYNQTNMALDAVKTRYYQDLMTPVSAFITFESEEGYHRGIVAHHHHVRILDEKIDISEAPEPTNIIWENRQFNFFQRSLRALLAIFVLAILLAMSFYVVVELKKVSKEVNLKYQKSNCKLLY